jgi:hypothetical protein
MEVLRNQSQQASLRQAGITILIHMSRGLGWAVIAQLVANPRFIGY